jgi:hypothetical protein
LFDTSHLDPRDNVVASPTYAGGTLLANAAVVQTDAKSLSANVPLPGNTLTSVITSNTLVPGRWVIRSGVSIFPGTSFNCEVTAVVASGAATLSGQLSAQAVIPTGGLTTFETIPLSFVFDVTAAATFTIKVMNNSSAAAMAEATTPSTGYTGATGYVAEKTA